jgi:hypothetical protein
VFRTCSLAEATFLALGGHSYSLNATPDRPGQVTFAFQRTPALEADIQTLALNDASVDPLAFERVRKELLHSLHDFLREEQLRANANV